MNDERYTFIEHQKETKALARSARHRIVGSRTKHVRLSTDNLTNAQLKRRNGPMSTYDISRPHTYCELKQWPKDIQKEYMEKLLEMNPSNDQIGELLGIKRNTACWYKKCLGLTAPNGGRGHQRGQTPEQAKAWKEFINGETETEEEEEATYSELEREPADPPVRTTECVPELVFDKVRLTFSGTFQDFIRLLVTRPPMPTDSDQVYEIYISADRKEACDENA